MGFRELTIDDLKDKLSMKGTLFDVLAATAERAKEIYDNQEAAVQTRPKRRREKSVVADEEDYGEGEASTSAASKKRRKRNLLNSPNNGEQPPLPEEFKNVIEEMGRGKSILTPATLVIQKGLFGTDLSSGHNRFSIPFSQITDNFLTEEEKQFLCNYGGNKKKNYYDVKIVQPSLESETIKLCRWDMPKKNGGKMSSSYVLNGKWNSIVEKNKLRVGMVVQLWCFRVDQELCFALVRLPSNHT